jgi:predicted secreted protein
MKSRLWILWVVSLVVVGVAARTGAQQQVAQIDMGTVWNMKTPSGFSLRENNVRVTLESTQAFPGGETVLVFRYQVISTGAQHVAFAYFTPEGKLSRFMDGKLSL